MIGKKAKLSVTLTDKGEGHIGCEISMEGIGGDLMEALENLTIKLLESIAEAQSEKDATLAYAVLLKSVIEGTDFLAASFADFQKASKKAEALLSILGKTFTVDGKEVKDGEEE